MTSSIVAASDSLPVPDIQRSVRATLHKALWGLWMVSLLLGGIGVYQRFTQGHLPAGYGSYVPWGLWVALYFHGVGIAGGAFVLGAGGYVLGVPGFRSPRMLRTAIVLSIAAMLPSFLGVWLDLGHLDRAHFIYLRPALTSMMAFNAWMYNVFILIAAACFFLSLRRDDRQWLKPLLCLGILFSVLFPSQSGAFFGVVDAKPYWHSPLLPILFLTSAITAGGAVLLCVRWLLVRDNPERDQAIVRLRWVVLGGLMAYFVLEFAEFSLAIWNPSSHAPAVELVLWGRYWRLFWIVHAAFGGVLPFALLVNRRQLAWVGAAGLIAVTFVSSRLIVLVPGQVIGELQGLQDAFHHPRLKYMYSVTWNEYLVGLFMLATGMAVFYVGHRINQYLTRGSWLVTRGPSHEARITSNEV